MDRLYEAKTKLNTMHVIVYLIYVFISVPFNVFAFHSSLLLTVLATEIRVYKESFSSSSPTTVFAHSIIIAGGVQHFVPSSTLSGRIGLTNAIIYALDS